MLNSRPHLAAGGGDFSSVSGLQHSVFHRLCHPLMFSWLTYYTGVHTQFICGSAALHYTFAKPATNNYDLKAYEEEDKDELLSEKQYWIKMAVDQISQEQ